MTFTGLQPSATPATHQSPAKRDDPDFKEGPSILLVDDDVLSTAARKMILELKFHCHVDTAPNALDGLYKMGPGSYDLLITDFHMQPLNGLQLAAVTRVLWPLMRILMLTGDSSVPSEVSSCVDDLVLKGNTPEFFLSRVALLLPEITTKGGH